jgi:SAM-dependent methyltransferase
MRDRKQALSPTTDREAWVRSLRRVNELQEDALAPVFDERWGEIEDGHRAFVERFLSLLPPDGRVLDAACGTGKYFSIVLDSGRSLCGFDHSGAYLAQARAKYPSVATKKHDLQNLPYANEFDGVMCDWPGILTRFRRALRPEGWLYLTVELAPEAQLQALNDAARRSGHPVVEREVLGDEPEGLLYHHYPAMAQVRKWLTAAGFAIEEDVEGPWHDDHHAYHHILAIARESGC